MKKAVFFFICLSLVFVIGCQKDSEKYIAIVNDGKIDRAKFDKIVDKRIQQMEKMGQKVAPEQKYEFQKMLLDNFVTMELLTQEARKAGVSTKDEDFNKRFAAIKERYPKKEDFDKVLKDNDIREDELKEELRKTMTIDAFLKKEIFDRIQVDDADLRKFYEENKKYFDMPPQVKASHILLKPKAKAGTPEAAKEEKEMKDKLTAVRKDIVDKKKDFAASAKEFSECPSKDSGGDLGYFSKEKMIPEFSREAFSLPVGAVSQPFKTNFGYHILVVTDKKAAHLKTFEESKEEIRQVIMRQRSGAKVREYVENLKKKAKITSFLQEPPAPPAVSTPATTSPAPVPAVTGKVK